MKTKITVASFGALAIVLAVCALSLQETQRRLNTVQIELETRKDIWRKLLNIAGTYKGVVNVSVPEYQKGGMIVRHSDWEAGARYEFANDGMSVRTFLSEGKEVGWTFIPGRSLKGMH